MKKILLQLVILLLVSSCSSEKSEKIETYCNPVNLNYRFQFSDSVSYREAADPLIRMYKDKYILYASHSGGYWYSDDLLSWKHIPVKSLPIEDYAPDVITYNDTTFYIASAANVKPFFYTTNPLEDNWKQYPKMLPFAVWDPHFFQDDDGKRYLYWGCSNVLPIYGVSLGANMMPVTEPAVFISHNHSKYGWEVPGEMNELTRNGYNEGPWMTKHNSKYYLQYAAPGTEFKTYADGVYTSDSPLGPFKYENYSPFSYKTGGFISGAGHSGTFQDKYGNYWHISSMTISIRHMFERRLGIFPVAFDKDGVMRTITTFGDYPAIMPDRKIDFEKEDLFRGWQLLSFKKNAEASSSMEKYPVKNAFDEEIRTWWSANSGNAGEWLSVELNDQATINAIQVNFADNESNLKPDSKNIYYQFRILASNDKMKWSVIVDKSKNTTDACHDFIILDKPLKAKYLKLENVRVPDGKFSVYDLRIFGLTQGNAPSPVNDFTVERNQADTRRAVIKWTKDINTTGYIVKYGIAPDKLYTTVMVYDSDSLTLPGLNMDVTYYYCIDAFNESGITKGVKIVKN
jgi:xylan 1,4-beta-xylosidase